MEATFGPDGGSDAALDTAMPMGADESRKRTEAIESLSYAAARGNLADVKGLLQKRAVWIRAGWTALNRASSRGWTEVVQHLMEEDNWELEEAICEGDVKRLPTNMLVTAKSRGGWTALIEASCKGHVKVVQALKEFGFKQARDCDQEDMKKELLARAKGHWNAKSNDGDTALLKASRSGHAEVVKALLEVLEEHKQLEVEKEHKQLEEEYLEVKDAAGWSALVNASYNGHDEVVKILLHNHAKVEAHNQAGERALIKAGGQGHQKVVEVLLAGRADVNAKDGAGWTALMRASANGHVKVVESLLQKRADVDAKCKDECTALHQASSQGHAVVVNALLQGGLWGVLSPARDYVDAKCKDGTTALLRASCNGHAEVVELLLRKHADLDAKSKDGDNAFMMARCWGHEEVIKMLEECRLVVEEVELSYRQQEFAENELEHARLLERIDEAWSHSS